MTLGKLLNGFQLFQAEYFENSKFYDDLTARGQSPQTLVIACSDSRNDPAHLMRSEPGELFIIRNVAAIVPPYQPDTNYHGTSAAIEFAVKTLQVKNIVVLGHALCGGVQALATAEQQQENEFLSHWLTIGQKAREQVEDALASAEPAQKLRALEQAVILTSLNNLMTFPWIKEKMQSGHIALNGWYFDMVHGQLLGYDFAEGIFKELPKSEENLAPTLHEETCCPDEAIATLLKNYS